MSKDNSHSVLGLENNAVRLNDYTPLWADLYREEEERIMTAAGHLIIELQHIGSTAIPGIKAKPILDMMAGVAQLEKALLCKAPLEVIGYDYIPQAGIANDYVFGKGVARTHYLHVVEYGGAKWANHLCFRDRLRNDPELAQAYAELKEELSRKFSDSRAKYHDAKTKFISEVVRA
ncbi:MAG TPA: GrpB family protein [Pyrinomonadaceae bacterium]|nr:GrpB family protein [Pyrinomonadaceae bacterium]